MENTDIITTDSKDSEEKDSTEAYLVLKEEFYNKIAEGKKTVEYRDFKDYWIVRLLDHPLKTVRFNLGTTKEYMVFEIEWIGVMDGDYEIAAFNEKGEMNDAGKVDDFMPDTIAIHLGKRLK